MNSGEVAARPGRDERLLAHLGLYHVSLRPILERLFFDGADARNVLGRLAAAGRIRSRPLRGGPLRLYQLTAAEAATRGLPHRAHPLGSRALAEALAVLWFAACDEPLRYRLERPELEALLGTEPPHGPHVVEPGEPPRVYRVYVPGPQTRTTVIVKTLARYAGALTANEILASWMKNRLYAVAVLLDEGQRRMRVDTVLRRTSLPLEVRTAYAPPPHALHDAVRKLRHG
ncbi:MAG: hypothetical protein IT293_01700 [Deltaproteobacteria bacterium]|nr:hypothetical protein [Deltaproteobacteria bacterium]